MITSLVTGGAGFIGSHLARDLQALGHQVVIIDDLSGGFRENLPENAIFKQGSVSDHEFVQAVFSEYSFDYVYHLAAYAAEGLSHFIKRFNYTNNVIGSINVINEAVKHKIKCLVFTSSIAVYGSASPPMTEEMVPKPEDPYGIAKLAVEYDLRSTHEMFGLNHIIFRPHNVYGEFQNIGDKYRNVVGIFMNQLLQDKPLTIFGDGSQTRAFSYIGDISYHMANCVNIPEAYNQIINVGADQELTVNELAEAVMETMGKKVSIRHLENRNEVKHAFSDHSKAHSLFPPVKTHTLKEGLEKMATWVKKVGTKKSKKFADIEIAEKLPPVWLED